MSLTRKIFINVLCFSLVAGSCFLTGDQAFAQFHSTESEMNMGSNLSREIAREYSISNNPKDIERVNRIGGRIAAHCGRKELNYYFYVIDDKKIKNAFSIPGGYVYVFKGLLDLLNDDELAYVLAHEVGHIVARHAMKQLEISVGATLAVLASLFVRTNNPDVVRGVSLAIDQLMSGYSQKDEFEADSLAVQETKSAGYDPKAGISALEKLYRENKKEIGPVNYFRSHPYTAERLRNIRETLHMPISVEDYINSKPKFSGKYSD
jgi:beta-barrel assembly-enhancing protease